MCFYRALSFICVCYKSRIGSRIVQYYDIEWCETVVYGPAPGLYGNPGNWKHKTKLEKQDTKQQYCNNIYRI